MPTFQAKPLGRRPSPFSRFVPHVRNHPVLFFGLPFVLTIVGASFGLSRLTQTRYDYNAQKVSTLSKEEELNMKKDRRRIDIREEYYKLQAKSDELDDWEPKRIKRPEGVPEWGVPAMNLSDKALEPRDYSRVRSVLEASEGDGKGSERSEGDEKPLPAGMSRGRNGVVLGPDGKPCRACNSKLAFSQAMKTTLPGAASFKESTKALKAKTKTAERKVECPPDGTELGRSTWTFLHSAAAYYPDKPSLKHQNAMRELMHSVSLLYPCAPCAEALRDELGRDAREGGWEAKELTLETAISSGPQIRRWLCGIHNEVNERVGKQKWQCDEKTLNERWKDGPNDGRCD
ncbi:FAD-dependent thiol oxidase [Tilletiaria anomala UBC 951]|uniref:Sulfhydryl oxidase n=1 Tax=Tilletiaria anomala (strain ATCC 24038 / CBS 436.72 / UBC 951) TaxID=1037660 RepID=A0A066WLU0_TILAU|nr:FAD-dependent thiol oxidase [Tilletiaria anomala UBC 951]KDN51954.1 FAD-dependent thiol oxidase [Tilletiaria anomala UBC 951]